MYETNSEIHERALIHSKILKIRLNDFVDIAKRTKNSERRSRMLEVN